MTLRDNQKWLLKEGCKLIKTIQTVDGPIYIYKMKGEPPLWKVVGHDDPVPVDYDEYVQLCDERGGGP